MELFKHCVENYEIFKKLKDVTCTNKNGELHPYHYEDDVWTHTCMVYKEVYKFNNNILSLAALYHDVGKYRTWSYNEDKDKVTFYSHHNYSGFMFLDDATDLVNAGYINNEDIPTIFKLITYHMEGHLLSFEKLYDRYMHEDNEFKFKLNQLFKADCKGRLGVESEPRFVLFSDDTAPRSTKYECHMMIGLPCSGKTKIIKQLGLEGELLSRDNLVMKLGNGDNYSECWGNVDQRAVDKEFNQQFHQSKDKKLDIIIDKTNMTRKVRRRYLNQLPKSYKKIAHVVLSDERSINERNFNRRKSEGKFIPSVVFNGMINSFSCPTYDEFDEINWYFN